VSPQILHATPEESQADMEILTGIDGSLKERVEALEARIVKETLIRHRWNKTQTAQELGLSRVGLRNKLERYGLEKNSNVEAINVVA
jgi:two-component system response regulator HupR/HoxA